MASAPSFPERVHLFRNENGEELRVTIAEKQTLFQTGRLVQTGQLGQQLQVYLYSSRGQMVAQTSANDIDFPDENLIKGHWKKLDLLREFAGVDVSGLPRHPEIPQLWMRDTEPHEIGQISECEIHTNGAKMDGTPPVLATSFEDAFRQMKVDIPETLRQNLMQCGTWTRPPTLLEKYMITAGLSNRDVLCIAPAGSGQTRAFLLPMLHNMMTGLKTIERSAPNKICFPDTLILCATQEGAAECHRVASSLLRGSRFRCVCLHHQSIREQVQDLALGVDVLIATPACLNAVVSQKIVRLDQVFGFVMVDASCMIDMGMRDVYQALLKFGMTPSAGRVSMMLMNSMVNPDVLEFSQEVLHEPIRLHVLPNVSNGGAFRTGVEILCVEDAEKLNRLETDLQERLQAVDSVDHGSDRPKRILVWVNSKARAQFFDEHFYHQRVPCAALWQSRDAWQKKLIWRQFCDGVIKVIFTTDAGCNGLDISAVDVLLHYDLPSKVDILSLRLHPLRIWFAKVVMYVNLNHDHDEVLAALVTILSLNGVAVPDWLANSRQRDRNSAAWDRTRGEDREDPDQWQAQPWDRNDNGWNSQWWQNDSNQWDSNRWQQGNGWNERWSERRDRWVWQ